MGVARGRVMAVAEGRIGVAIDPHLTARGTAIGSKRWEIAWDAAAGIVGGLKVCAPRYR
jgi:hypothetical protein